LFQEQKRERRERENKEMSYQVTVVDWNNYKTSFILFSSMDALLNAAKEQCIITDENAARITNASTNSVEFDSAINDFICDQYSEIYSYPYSMFGWTRIVRLSDQKVWPTDNRDAVIESAYVVTLIDCKYCTHVTKIYQTTEALLSAIREEKCWSSDDENNDVITPYTNEEFTYMLTGFIEEEHDKIYYEAAQGWASIVVMATKQIFGEEGARET